MVSKIEKSTKKSSKAIISEEILPKEIIECKSEKIFGTDSRKIMEKIQTEEEKEIFELDEHLFHEGTQRY